MRGYLLAASSVIALGAALVAGPAFAADLMQPPEVTPAMMSPSSIVGYVDLHIGTDAESSSGESSSSDSYFDFGGAGRAAVQFDPNMSVQADAWFDDSEQTGSSDESDSYFEGGLASHLTWHTGAGTSLGVMGSLGSDQDGLEGTAAVEGVLDIENWRLYGQAGVTHGLTGDSSYYDKNILYAELDADYFIDPNFMISGNVGAGNTTYNDTSTSYRTVNWGLKAEFKPAASPVSFYATYQGFNYSNSSDSDSSTDNFFGVGIRVPFGAGSLQDLQNAVGLADMNPDYGDYIDH